MYQGWVPPVKTQSMSQKLNDILAELSELAAEYRENESEYYAAEIERARGSIARGTGILHALANQTEPLPLGSEDGPSAYKMNGVY